MPKRKNAEATSFSLSSYSTPIRALSQTNEERHGMKLAFPFPLQDAETR